VILDGKRILITGVVAVGRHAMGAHMPHLR
jgi:hypothetical protein